MVVVDETEQPLTYQQEPNRIDHNNKKLKTGLISKDIE